MRIEWMLEIGAVFMRTKTELILMSRRVVPAQIALRRFRVTIDLSNQRMILEPSALFDVPYDYDLTGFTIVANGQVFGIGSVEHGTSAERAGLRPGDVIEELDGKPVQRMRLADLQRAFVQDGRDRLLKIRRLGVERTTTLKMLAIR